MCYAEIKTKSGRVDYIREKIKSSDRWMLKALFTIFDNQTADEQRVGEVKENNGIGFTGIDGELLTSFAKQLIERGVRDLIKANSEPINARRFLSEKQVNLLRQKMPKYARQLSEIANTNVPIVKTPKGSAHGCA
jgi:hypothetical protein